MRTPICDFVRDYAAAQPLRLHMPGHKGTGEVQRLDITEIPGADVLYHPTGIILESERNAAALFGSRRTVYSAEGSSLPIRAMVYLTARYAQRTGRRPVIAAGRNAHRVFVTAAALLDIPIRWLYPAVSEGLPSCQITPAQLEKFLSEGEPPTAVYVTSPDYLGNILDISGLAQVCRRFGCLLLVDNAHGAYLNFLPESRHPMALGADMCCDSAHKTLPVLTGGAYLHISGHAPAEFAEEADAAMALFASTSPSYLILQSLDAANAALAGSWPGQLSQAVELWDTLKRQISALGFPLAGQEPLKLTLMPKAKGCTGEELSHFLEARNIYPEFADPDYLVLMLPWEPNEAVSEKLLEALSALPPKPPILTTPPKLGRPRAVGSHHDCLLAPSHTVRVEDAVGCVMADPMVSCPPAIPVVCCGEQIEPWAVEAMRYYGITQVRVVK